MQFIKMLSVSLFFLFTFSLSAQEVKIIKKPDMMKLINSKDGKLRVINFWATWCKPCVKELPYFENLHQKYASNENVELYLISLDFATQVEKVKKFVEKKGLTATILLLDETDYNAWINDVAPEWQGDIPATLFVNKKEGKRVFLAEEFSQEGLEKEVKKLL